MKENYLKAFFVLTVLILFIGIPVFASVPTVNQVQGRIMWVDVKLGTMQIKVNQAAGMGETRDYRITRYETRVKDTSDRKFLTIDDLRAGEIVTLNVIDGQENKIIEKIISESLEASDFQEVKGTIQAIDTQKGIITLDEKIRNGVDENSKISNFYFEPNNIVEFQSPVLKPVNLDLKSGDQVKIQFVMKDEKQQTYSITLYAPAQTTTTTVTTTTSTQ